LCLCLPRWPTDRLARATPSLDRRAPLVLYEKAANALRLYAVNKAASALGLKRGEALADARARVPGLIAEKADPEGDRKAFLRLCEQHMRYSPLVAPHEASDILIDITGAAHLFGGEESLIDEALARLEAFGVEASAAIADSIGASWAGAHTHRRLIVPPRGSKQALANLSVAVLRLDDETNESLKRLGLKTVRQLYGLPRAPLAARFGKRLSERLDQALDLAPEALTPLTPPPEYDATLKLAEPIATEESVLQCLAPLAEEIQTRLAKDGKGGRRFELALYRVDNAVARVEVRTSAPTREAGHVMRLIANKLKDASDEFDAGFGFEVIRLSARACDPVGPLQADAFGKGSADDRAAALIDRLSNRLGAANVVRMVPLNSHLPERAVSYAPALSAPKKAPVPPPLARQSPLRLLPRPEAIKVMAEIPDGPPIRFTWRRVSYRVARASGPERVEDEWWRGRKRRPRDYYRIETAEGWRFWIFRAGFYGESEAAPEWRLHGFFA